MEGMVGNRCAYMDKISLNPNKHIDETGLAHPSWSVDEELVVFVGNLTITECRFEDLVCGVATLQKCDSTNNGASAIVFPFAPSYRQS